MVRDNKLLKDQRIYSRYKVEHDWRLKVIAPSKSIFSRNKKFSGEIIDISEGGVKFKLNEILNSNFIGIDDLFYSNALIIPIKNGKGNKEFKVPITVKEIITDEREKTQTCCCCFELNNMSGSQAEIFKSKIRQKCKDLKLIN